MTDNFEPRQLSRRERRMLEMSETNTVSEVADVYLDSQIDPVRESSVEDAIEISPVDEFGNVRTRRQIRELRQQMLVSLGLDTEVSTETSEFQRVIIDAVENDEVSAEEVVDAANDAHFVEVDALVTEHVELIQLTEHNPAQDATEQLNIVSEDPLPTPKSAKRKSKKSAELKVAPTQVETDAVGHQGSDDSSAPAEELPTYSFPDIAPLDDAVSIFDDPAVRSVVTPRSGSAVTQGEFDALISRAVAQEGAASATNTSALILPLLPDTGALAGPIGETGELFITGSIELPKSLGETGGHATLHDSVESDPLDELGFEALLAPSTDLTQPVSAVRAVSARSVTGSLVSESQKEKSKLPIVLISTGGGLLIGLAALLIWGASNGLFG